MISLDNVKAAQQRIAGAIVHTPLLRLEAADVGCDLYVKAENLQPVGAFKLRGAYNKIASLSDEEQQRGIIAFSSGNHAQGVAYAARALGVKATVVMPAVAPKIKRQKTEALGAEVVILAGGSEEDWRVAAEDLAAEHGYVMVTPFNDEAIIAGQATAGLEILADLPQVSLVLAPIGGGGLISGVAAALKLSGAPVKVIGVEPELADDARQSFYRGQIVELPKEQTSQTMADGMRATRVGDINFAHIQAFVDDIITVSESQIKAAMRRLVLDARLVVEPSGAVACAALLYCRDQLPQCKANVAIISGGNVEPSLLAEVLAAAS